MPAPPVLAGVPPMYFAPPSSAAPGGVAAAFDGLLGPDGYPSPRVAAIAVIALLGFGTLIGSFLGGPGGAPFWILPNSSPVAQVAPAPAENQAAAAEAPAAEAPQAAPEISAPDPTAPTSVTGTVKHVWLIVLSGQGYDASFGNADSPAYLVNTLASQGAVVENYYSVAQGELANRIALISGQGPTWQITDNCPSYTDLAPATVDAANFNQAAGDGCVFPESVRNIGDAITASGKTFAVYAQGSDTATAGRGAACQVPAANASDPNFTSSVASPYTTWSNPFMYFKSLAASANCQYTVYGLANLKQDLDGQKSPALSMVIPDRCDSGSETPCGEGAPAGLTSSDQFLRDVVGAITASKDYADGGLIAITFDQSNQDLPEPDVSGCCGQPAFPNLSVPRSSPTGPTGPSSQAGSSDLAGAPAATRKYRPTANDGSPAGGGKVGLLLISPTTRAGSVETTGQYNHFSLLLSIENWFATEKLGYSADSNLKPIPDELIGIKSEIKPK